MVRHREPRHAARGGPRAGGRGRRRRARTGRSRTVVPNATHGMDRLERGPAGGRKGGREGGGGMRRRRRRRRRLAELALRRRAVGGWNRAFLPPHCIPAGAAAGHVRVGAAVLRQLGGRAGIRGPIQMQKFWLEFWLENWLEILLEIFFTGKSPKMGSLDMLRNQKVISSQFSSQISSQNFCF